jgi:hypothetical protein
MPLPAVDLLPAVEPPRPRRDHLGGLHRLGVHNRRGRLRLTPGRFAQPGAQPAGQPLRQATLAAPLEERVHRLPRGEVHRQRPPLDPELEAVLRAAEKQGWMVTKGKKYFKLMCSCPDKHQGWVHLTPSGAKYTLNLVKQLKRATCWKEDR